MDRQIVHDHDIAALECRNEALLHIGEKHRIFHGSLVWPKITGST
jgi:hypothetical protein